MGLFKKKTPEPRVHQAVPRTVYVAAPLPAVRQQLADYSAMLSPNGAASTPLRLGQVNGWTFVSTSTAMHPWAHHNLGFWLLDTPSGSGADSTPRIVVVRAGLTAGAEPTSGYTLAADPELDSCLCGHRDDGAPMTVYVPENRINNSDAVPFRATVPFPDASLLAALAVSEVATVLLEDPGHELNPDNSQNADSRRSVVPHYQTFT